MDFSLDFFKEKCERFVNFFKHKREFFIRFLLGKRDLYLKIFKEQFFIFPRTNVNVLSRFFQKTNVEFSSRFSKDRSGPLIKIIKDFFPMTKVNFL